MDGYVNGFMGSARELHEVQKRNITIIKEGQKHPRTAYILGNIFLLLLIKQYLITTLIVTKKNVFEIGTFFLLNYQFIDGVHIPWNTLLQLCFDLLFDF